MASYDQLVKDSKGTVFNVAANVAYSTPDQLAMDLGVKANQIQWGNIKTDANYKLPSITSSQLQSPPQVQVPTAPATTAQANSAVAGSQQATSAAQDMINKANALQTPEQKQASSYTQDILTLLDKTSGQKQALLEEQNKAGLPQMNQEVVALNADLQRQVAEYNAIKQQYDKLVTDEQGKVKTMGAIRGEEARLARSRAAELNLKASEAKITEARIAGKLGQIEQAQTAAKQAVELRYAADNEALEIKTKQLTALKMSGILDEQQTIQAEARAKQSSEELALLNEKKEQAKANIGKALNSAITSRYANNNGTFFNTYTGEAFSTAEEFFRDAGISSFEEAYAKGLVQDVKPPLTFETKEINGREVRLGFDKAGNLVSRMDLGSAKKPDNPNKSDKYTVQKASDEIRDTWQSSGFLQGNGKISSIDYKKGKSWWVQQGLSAEKFDETFGYLIDTSGEKWKSDYGYKGN